MTIRHRFTKATIATGVATALMFGCGSSSSSESANTDVSSGIGGYGKTEDTTNAASPTTSQIVIESSAFTVAGDVKSTDALSATNRDGFAHTVTSDDGVFDITVGGGATMSLPTLNPGTYAFHCKIHTSMRGTLTVLSPTTTVVVIPGADVVITDEQAATLIGKTEANAETYALANGWVLRVGQRDGESFMLTTDYLDHRVTVSIDKGVVTGAKVG